MSINFTLPPEIEHNLRSTFADFDQTAKEAALVELYRQQRLTLHQLSQALGLTRFETNAILKTHNVSEDLLTVEEFNRQADGLQRAWVLASDKSDHLI